MSPPGCLNVALAVAIGGIVVCFEEGVHSQGAVTPVNDLPSPYETITDWGKFPGGRIFGNTSGVDIDPDGKSVWAVDRCGADSCAGSNLTVVLKFDPSGKLVKSFGAGMLVYPHGIHVDREGNVWVTDGRAATPEELKKFPGEKAKGHTVIKFSPEGKVLMTLGKPGVAGDPPNLFNEPAAVITAPNGDIFVADGHSGGENTTPSTKVARIVKFDRNGKFLKSWGKFGAGPGELKGPHALAFDSRGRLFVADRANFRLQIFDQDGKHLAEWKQFSRASGLYIRNDMVYTSDSGSDSLVNPGWKKGIRIGSARDGKVMFFIPPHANNIREGGTAAGGVAVDAAGNVFGAETPSGGLTKYVKR
jgi:sugar lactone lactonase YvrE